MWENIWAIEEYGELLPQLHWSKIQKHEEAPFFMEGGLGVSRWAQGISKVRKGGKCEGCS